MNHVTFFKNCITHTRIELCSFTADSLFYTAAEKRYTDYPLNKASGSINNKKNNEAGIT